jgi:hypothetical protein
MKRSGSKNSKPGKTSRKEKAFSYDKKKGEKKGENRV